MLRFTAASVTLVAFVVGGLIAAPVPAEVPAKTLVVGLGDPDAKVRDASAVALKDRVDALPWLRRAARATDKDTAKRAATLLTPYELKRQEAVAKAIDACIRDGRIDLLTEWHQYWKPKAQEDLWEIIPRATKAGFDLYAKSCPKDAWETLEKTLAWSAKIKTTVHDGPYPERFPPSKVAWLIRTDRLDGQAHASAEVIRFASVAGPARLMMSGGGRYLVLGPVEAGEIGAAFVAADGGISSPGGRSCRTAWGVVVCRGNFVGRAVFGSVILVDGDIDLTSATDLRSSLIRATGEIRLPKGVTPDGCTIEANTKDATAPYKFFELSDVGLSVVDNDGGLLVTAVKADTPFGDCGLTKGDVIRAIDDTPTGRASEFRKLVRRALVRQGDCLVTVVRGGKTLDFPIFFPLPK